MLDLVNDRVRTLARGVVSHSRRQVRYATTIPILLLSKTVSLAHPAARFARASRNLRRDLQFAAVRSRSLNFYQGTRIVES
jgi:hypothetical protein